MNPEFFLLLYVLDIKRSPDKIVPPISDNDTVSGMAGENCAAHDRKSIVRNIFPAGPEGGDDFGLSVVVDGLEEDKFIAGISDSSAVENEGVTIRAPAATVNSARRRPILPRISPVDDDVPGTGDECAALQAEYAAT